MLLNLNRMKRTFTNELVIQTCSFRRLVLYQASEPEATKQKTKSNVCPAKTSGSSGKGDKDKDKDKEDKIDLKEILKEKIPAHIEKVKKFREQHGSSKISDITVNMIYGGMRGIRGLLCETSEVDANEGIKFRGYTINDVRSKLPKAKGGTEPLPEGLFWLLVTGDIPTEKQVAWVTEQWNCRAELPNHVLQLLLNFPTCTHPMSQLSCALTALNTESKFAKAYEEQVPVSKAWEYAYEDAMDLIAKIHVIAACIYRFTYFHDKYVTPIKTDLDWAANLVNMMGYGHNKELMELMRLYMVIHSDHEGGNVSSHAVHLVGSALSDPYLAMSAGINGLAGPLHGLANQQVLAYLESLVEKHGSNPSDEVVKKFVQDTLKSGQPVPGYGHAVLRVTDPRFTSQDEFATKHIKDDPLVKIVKQMFKIVPEILKATGKVQSPYPNVDAYSGSLLQYYGITQKTFYTVLFGVSRALGTMASLLWHRALGLPLERPKSLSTDQLIKLVMGKK